MAECAKYPDRECVCEAKVNGLQRELDRAHETHEKIFSRLSALERTDERRGEQIDNLVEKIENLTNQVAALVSQLADVQAKPGKRWDAIVDKAIWAVLAALIAFILARIGL